jgi:hypothetical protein
MIRLRISSPSINAEHPRIHAANCPGIVAVLLPCVVVRVSEVGGLM